MICQFLDKSMNMIFFKDLFFYCCTGWNKLWHLQKFLSYLDSLSPPFSFIPATSHYWNSLQISFFSYTLISTKYLYHIHHPTPFSHALLPLTDTNTSNRNCYTLLVSDFIKKIFPCFR
jgi:hypothetical protein